MSQVESFNNAIILEELLTLDNKTTWEDAIVYIDDNDYLVIESRLSNDTIIEFSKEQLEELLLLITDHRP